MLYILLIILFIPSMKSLYSCLDESGNAVDYWIAIKASGSSYYYYYDENSNLIQFTKSNYLVNQTSKGSIMQTVNQIYSFSSNENIALGMYSDEPPDSSTASSTYAHSKGILLSDNTQGFWLTHSKPNWPASRNTTLGLNAAIGFPDDTYAQHLMCITINSTIANTIAKGLYIDRTKIYSSYYTTSTISTMPSFYSWIQQSAKSSKTNSTYIIYTLKGNKFVQFAKSKEWDKDLWDDFVAPYYKSPMNIETWINGAGGRMSSACGTYSILTYDIYEVNNVIMNDLISWSNTQDHSKWGVSTNTASIKVACVGDINRMCSQESRGGGALCFANDNAWNIFNNIVSSVESCYLYNPCSGSSQCYWCSNFFLPSYSPTASPYPTYKPSKSPSYKPSKIPTVKPTTKPTGPSYIPSYSPSFLPSFATDRPTITPSITPTITPSTTIPSPSTSTTSLPSINSISETPSYIPITLSPSTLIPTYSSELPTFEPSTVPPTYIPSINPSSIIQPSYIPTLSHNISAIPSATSTTEPPTISPTMNLDKNTLVALSSTQLLININISLILSPESNYLSFTNGFTNAIKKVLINNDITLYTFTIDSIIQVESISNTINKRVLYISNEIKVAYTLNIVLEDTMYQNSNDLATAVTNTIMTSCNDSTLLNLFKSSGDSNLGNVTGTLLLNKFIIVDNNNNDSNDDNSIWNSKYFFIGIGIGIGLFSCICCSFVYCCWSNSKKNNKSSKLLDSYKFQYKYNDTFEYTNNNYPTHNPVLSKKVTKHKKTKVSTSSSANKKKHVELKSVNI